MLKKTVVTAVAALLTATALSAQPNKNADNKEANAPNKNTPVVLPSPNRQNNAQTDTTKPNNDPPAAHTPLHDSNWMLVIVGSVTCLVIGWQSWETRKAGQGAQRAADAAFAQIDLMVERQRAKLRIKLDEFQPVKDEHETYWVKGHVSIYGSTEAFIERTEIYASIGAAGIFNPLQEWLWGIHHVPAVIRSTAEPIPIKVMVMAADGPATDSEFLSVREAKEFVYVMAKIEFADTFGRKWVLRMRQRFGFIWSDVESPGSGGSWEDSGPASDNGEYRVESEQASKPN